MGRHSAPRTIPKVAVLALPIAAVVGIAGAAALVNDDSPGDAAAGSTSPRTGLSACSSVTPMRVTTTEELAPVLGQVAQRQETRGDDCIDYTVDVQSSSVTASGLMSGADDRTQVWIPDSSLWAERVTSAAPSTKLDLGPVVATSPVVFAIPRGAGSTARPGPLTWSQLISQRAVPLKVASPERSTPSLLALLGAKQAVASSPQDARALQGLLLTLSRSTADEADLRRQALTPAASAPAFPTSEQQLAHLNQANPKTPLRAMTPSDATPQLDYRLVTVVGKNAPPEAAVAKLQDALADAQSVDALRKAGFRIGESDGPDLAGVPASLPKVIATPRASDADTALRTWVTMSRQTRMLAVVDTSESMNRPAIPGMNRLQLASGAALKALEKFPPSSQIGLWTFDLAHGSQDKDWVERVPIRRVDATSGPMTQRQALARAGGSVQWQRANGTAVHDTIWAGYQQLQRTYQPDYANALVLLTDGKNEDPDSLSEAQLVANLEQASKDSSRPVRIVLIAISQDADLGALQRIAAAVPDGQAYDARRPENIYGIMQTALTTREIVAPAQ